MLPCWKALLTGLPRRVPGKPAGRVLPPGLDPWRALLHSPMQTGQPRRIPVPAKPPGDPAALTVTEGNQWLPTGAALCCLLLQQSFNWAAGEGNQKGSNFSVSSRRLVLDSCHFLKKDCCLSCPLLTPPPLNCIAEQNALEVVGNVQRAGKEVQSQALGLNYSS